MSSIKIAVTSPSFSKNKLLSSEISSIFPNAKLNLDGTRFDKQSLIEYLKEADAAVVGLEIIDDEVLAACPKLKIIAKYGVGLDGIDLDACKKRGVAIGWSGGVNRLSVAEMALGFMLMLCRNLYVTSNQLKNGTWNKTDRVITQVQRLQVIQYAYACWPFTQPGVTQHQMLQLWHMLH